MSYITENIFANRLVDYVQGAPELRLKNEGELPDNWTLSLEGRILEVYSLAKRGLINDFFKTKPIIPKKWSEFREQYLIERYPELPGLQSTQRYECANPSLFMIGKTIEITGSEAKQQVFQIIVDNTNPRPKYQDIMFVLAEKKGISIQPKYVGTIDAFMLENHVLPEGHIFNETTYLISQEDLTEQEKNLFKTTNTAWKWNYRHIIRNHQYLLNER